MITQWLTIKPEEPLLLGDVRYNTNFLSTLDYIPGRVLRGSWANWLKGGGNSDNIAEWVRGLRIGNFFPLPEWREIRYVSPFLLSMLSCKQDSGFQSEPHKDNRGHGVVDSLLVHIAYHLLEECKAQIAVPFSIRCHDQRCKSRMEPGEGFFSVQYDDSSTWYIKSRPGYHTQTRAALSRYRNASYEGMLYTTTAISPVIEKPDDKGNDADIIFLGKVQGTEDKIENLIEALDSTPIGSKCSIGYGSVTCEEEQIRLPSIEDRLDAFNKQLLDLWADLKRLSTNANANLPEQPPGDYIYFSVDLLSPAIFRDEAGLPSLVPDLRSDGKRIESVLWLTRPGFAGGWSDAWGLQKPTALAARMGSSYVFRCGESKEDLVDFLEHIEESGVGERCEEGFGECWICHPFHQEVREK